MKISKQSSPIFVKVSDMVRVNDSIKISLPTGIILQTGPGTVTSSEVAAQITNGKDLRRAMQEASKTGIFEKPAILNDTPKT